jgi:arginyl-tRNA synthetase
MNILRELRARFAAALTDLTEDPRMYAEMVRPSQDARFGDYQANFAMSLARLRGEKPPELASRVIARLDVADLCEPPQVAGPGFINLHLRQDWMQRTVLTLAGDERLGVRGAAEPRHIVIDYSSPNVAKPMHVGHLRATVVGDALYRILQFLGHRVTSDNHVGDWGTQFGMLIFGYKQFLDEEAYVRNPVVELARLYRLVHTLSEYHEARERGPGLERRQQELEEQVVAAQARAASDKSEQKVVKGLRADLAELRETAAGLARKIASVEADETLRALARAHPDIARAARLETARLHAGDPENNRLWQQFVPACLEALDAIYDRLDVHFDLTLGESHYQPLLADVVSSLQREGLAVTSDGAACVFLEGHEAPFIIQKSDGAYTYATTDLATVRHRVEQLRADAIVYVVDARQSEHFRQLFATARRWGYRDVAFEHVAFGTVMGKDRRPYKTRSGDTVGLESLLDEAVAKAYDIVAANDDAKPDGPELDEAARRSVAEIVGIGGIKYADLHIHRESDYVFDWDTMLTMKGDTATYMQYAYARTRGIFRKGAIDPGQWNSRLSSLEWTEPAERSLALKLLRFPEALDAAAAEYRPNLLTAYLFDLANEFSTFFEQCPVLKASDPSTRDGRLLLVDLTGRVIRQGLALLGIGTCDQM